MGMKEVAISLLNAPIMDLRNELAALSKLHPRPRIHLDIIDTSFVEANISFGPAIVNDILKENFVFDLHLMVKQPARILGCFNIDRVNTVYMHEDMDNHGIAINPDSPIVYKDKMLVMTVHAGRGGQTFIAPGQKIKKLKKEGCHVCVDGGINLDTIGQVIDADTFVIGSAYFNSTDKKQFIDDVYKRLQIR